MLINMDMLHLIVNKSMRKAHMHAHMHTNTLTLRA
jgi:hypothetical protein